jgi:hypothetical protein
MELFSEKVTAGNRTYFFDVKKSREGLKYLKISESRRKKSQDYEHFRVMIFEEHIPAFLEAFNKALAAMGFDVGATTYVKELRKSLPNAYRPWGKDDDERLEQFYCQKKSVEELAKIFKRNVGAIESRIRKLELRDKYGS